MPPPWRRARRSAIMRARYGEDCGQRSRRAVAYGEERPVGGVAVSSHPAGHMLGGAQVELRFGAPASSSPATTSGGPTRPAGPLSLSAATSSSPRRPSACRCSATSRAPRGRRGCSPRCRAFPDRAHLLGVYALGKCQRMIALLRQAGYDAADLSAWRPGRTLRPLSRGRHRRSATSPDGGPAQGACRRARDVPALGDLPIAGRGASAIR